VSVSSTVAGPAALESIARKEAALREAARLLKIGPWRPKRLQKLSRQRALEKQLAELEARLARLAREDLVKAVRQVKRCRRDRRPDRRAGCGWASRSVAEYPCATGCGSGSSAWGASLTAKGNLIAAVTKDLTGPLPGGPAGSGRLPRRSARGGGRPDLARRGKGIRPS